MALFALARRLARPQHQRLFSSAASALSNLPFASTFSDAKANSLRTHGYAVLDQCFGQELSAGARAEILELHEAGLLYPNTTHVIEPLNTAESKAPSSPASSPSTAATFVEKHNVFEIEAGALFRECGPDIVPQLHKIDALSSKYLLPAFQSALSRSAATPIGVQLDAAHAIKCQVNTGARGCFPMHVDADAQYSSRVLSSILYLNPEWRPSDGGELILYVRTPTSGTSCKPFRFPLVSYLLLLRVFPFRVLQPFPFDRVVVRPTLDRLVSFSSTAMLHRVLPSKATNRACLTVWHSRAASQPLAASSSSAQNIPSMPVHPTEKQDEAVFRDQVLAYLVRVIELVLLSIPILQIQFSLRTRSLAIFVTAASAPSSARCAPILRGRVEDLDLRGAPRVARARPSARRACARRRAAEQVLCSLH
jgi:hypothetical protein